MLRPGRPVIQVRPAAPGRSRRAIAAVGGLAIGIGGCGHEEDRGAKSVAAPPTVTVLSPPIRNIVRVVGQPSFIEAYERTSIYPKLTGYIETWVVDIGDRVKKGDVLATLYVPELVEDYGTKKANVELDRRRIDLAQQVVKVTDADVKAAQASLAEARSILAKYQAEVDRWDTEVKRLQRETDRGVVAPQIVLESTNQLKSSTAARDAARATIVRSEADLLSKEASDSKSRVDVDVARAALAVATSESKRLEAWVGYLKLTAPFDGVIVARNANTFDFVTPSTGDPTADRRSPDLSPSGSAAPIYVVDRLDIVRVFVDIPEADANYVKIGSRASVLARAYRDRPIAGAVTRTAWALNVKSRTLRAEIDLPNPGGQILPGVYADAKVIIERPSVRAVPTDALTYSGDRTFCWRYVDGKSLKTEVRTGVGDGDWMELTNLKTGDTSTADEGWEPPRGTEKIIQGDLSVLVDGGPVDLKPVTSSSKVASNGPATPGPGSRQ